MFFQFFSHLSSPSCPAAQAVHPGLSGGLLRRPGRQLQGPLLHGDQPLQHGQADHLALRLPLAAWRGGGAAARRQASERREPLRGRSQTQTSRRTNRRVVKNRSYRQKRHKNEQLHVYAKRWKHACRRKHEQKMSHICIFLIADLKV